MNRSYSKRSVGEEEEVRRKMEAAAAAPVGSCWMVEVGIATRYCACYRRLEAADSVATSPKQMKAVLLWKQSSNQNAV